MTEKQFTFDNDSLLKDGEFWLDGSVATICNAEEIVELLNEFHEENEQLKQQLKTKYIVNKQYEELQRLKEENKELKQKIESLKMEIAELRESEKDNYNITDGLW